MGECVGNAWVGTVLGMVHSLAVNSEAFSARVTFQKRKANRRRHSRWNTNHVMHRNTELKSEAVYLLAVICPKLSLSQQAGFPSMQQVPPSPNRWTY